MRPWWVTTPAPPAASQAATTARASSTAASLGANVALQTSTWPGWISVLPSKPSSRPCLHSASNPAASFTSL